MLTVKELESIRLEIKEHPSGTIRRIGHKDGLYIQVENKSMYWRMNYRFNDKQDTMAFGVYPKVSMSEAVKKCNEVHVMLDRGENPKKKKDKNIKSFKEVAEEWLEKMRVNSAEKTKEVDLGRLKNWIYPVIKEKKITEVNEQDILKIYDRILERNKETESRGVPTAKRVTDLTCRIMRYAKRMQYSLVEIYGSDLKQTLPPHVEKEMPALTNPDDVGDMLFTIGQYPRHDVVTKLVILFTFYSALRQGEILSLTWNNVLWNKKQILVPAENMKMKKGVEHIVPLSTQMVDILKTMQKLTGDQSSNYIFSLGSNRPISENTVNGAIQEAIDAVGKRVMTAHGCRAIFSTNCKHFGGQREWIELQLAHSKKARNKVEAAYNRDDCLEERTTMMQNYSDWLDTQRELARERAEKGNT